ncbi:MAG: hypothetical protein AB1726_14330 [Planctomycetota bacterium]
MAILATMLVLPGFSDEKSDTKVIARPGTEVAVKSIAGLARCHRLLEQAEKLFATQEYDQAFGLYEDVLALDPDQALAHARLGYLLVGQGQHKAAAGHFQRESELGHRPEVATYNLACAASLAGDRERALAFLQQAVRRGFADRELLTVDPDLEALHGDAVFAWAVESVEKAVMLRKKLATLKMAGDDKAALEAQAALVEIVSEDGVLVHDLGIKQLQGGELQRAADSFQRQMELGYQPASACYNLACARARSGDREGAIASLERSLALGMSFGGVLEDEDLKNLAGDPRFEMLKENLAAPEMERKKIAVAIAAGDFAAVLPVLEKMLAAPDCSPKLRGWTCFQIVGRAEKQAVAAALKKKQEMEKGLAVEARRVEEKRPVEGEKSTRG